MVFFIPDLNAKPMTSRYTCHVLFAWQFWKGNLKGMRQQVEVQTCNIIGFVLFQARTQLVEHRDYSAGGHGPAGPALGIFK